MIEPLKARILDVLEREGKALVALNTLLDRRRPARRDRRPQVPHPRRRRQPDDLELRLANGAAVAFNPIPVADMAGGLAVDVGMIVALEQGLRHPAHQTTAAGLVKDMMVALGAMGAVGSSAG